MKIIGYGPVPGQCRPPAWFNQTLHPPTTPARCWQYVSKVANNKGELLRTVQLLAHTQP